MADYLPLIIALISAVTVVFGYAYEKRKEREFELAKTRKEINKQLIDNLIGQFGMFEKIKSDPNLPSLTGNIEKFYEFIAENYSELNQSMNETQKIQTMMSVYGTDDAIKAAADYRRQCIEFAQGVSAKQPDVANLILRLRQSLFQDTKVTSEEIRMLMSK